MSDERVYGARTHQGERIIPSNFYIELACHPSNFVDRNVINHKCLLTDVLGMSLCRGEGRGVFFIFNGKNQTRSFT